MSKLSFLPSQSVNDVFYIEDIDRFIELVEARPALYNKNVKEYADLSVKKKLWEEICKEIYSFWEDMNSGLKYESIIRVQKKWTNLRSCFCRELKWQQRVKSGQASSKRRKYIHYEKLLFLTNILNNAESNNNDEFEEGSNDAEEHDTDDDNDDAIDGTNDNFGERNSGSEDEELRNKRSKENWPVTCPQTPSGSSDCKKIYKPQFEEVEINSPLPNYDEDTYFLLSLVPQIKTLTSDEKLDAKIAILQVIKDIKRRKINS
ncbi:uncharacterized protein LOC115442554 [Manduca sexta]|uniref:uncharacterized protein LOC115442554 n=1 Tax=Manduca sexta TaxID=7130 RepID=UPI00118321B1|nr:uncharacterized protein LOC115442554 [Manduca sexta]